MALAQAPEQRTPDRHFLGTVRGQVYIATNGAGDAIARELAAIARAEGGEIRRRYLECFGGRPCSFSILSMANRAIIRVNFRTGCR